MNESESQSGEMRAAISRVVEDLLASLSIPEADAIRLGAIPHWFDEDLLTRMSREGVDSSKVVNYLNQLSFAKMDNQGRFRYQQEVRRYLINWWLRSYPQRYLTANQIAKDYFQSLTELAPLLERASLERQVLYHQLVLDEETGLQRLRGQFEDAIDSFQLGLAEDLVRQASQLRDQLSQEGRNWLKYLSARINLAYRTDGFGYATFLDMTEQPTGRILEGLAYWGLGQVALAQKQWSQAIRHFRQGLLLLQIEKSNLNAARVMLSLGKAYFELAESSGGSPEVMPVRFENVSRFLYTLEHLPFLIYEWLAHRTSFVPDWYYGTNYQDWIIAYILKEATSWSKKAELVLRKIEDSQGLVEVRLFLAELEYRLEHWPKVRKMHKELLETHEVKNSLYRMAKIQLGQGRVLLDQGKLSDAEYLFSEALEVFRRFQDQQSIGVTANLKGKLLVKVGRLDEAVTTFFESIAAFRASGNYLALTQAISDLEHLTQSLKLSPQKQQVADSIISQVEERHYIARFPKTILILFRRLALLGALPLTYLAALFSGIALTQSLAVIEGSLRLSLAGFSWQDFPLGQIFILVLVSILPLPMALWLYRLIYVVIGSVFVQLLGRRLIPIEQEQPDYFITDTTGLTLRSEGKNSIRDIAWSELKQLAFVDYLQIHFPISLISRTLLINNKDTMVINGITADYDQLKRDILHRLRNGPGEVQFLNYGFVVFDPRSTLLTILASLIFALLAVIYGKIQLTVVPVVGNQQEQVLWFSPVMALFIPTLLLLFPVETLWRLVWHRIALDRTVQFQNRAIPLWLLVSGAVITTLIAVAWIGILLLLGRI